MLKKLLLALLFCASPLMGQGQFSGGGSVSIAASVPDPLNTVAIQDKGGQVYNVKAYGAVGNGVFLYTGSITTGTAALTVTGGSFAAGDVGKAIEVDGAGASSGNLITTISAVTDANHVTLAANAGTTVASNGIVVYGTDDGAAVQTLINTIVAAGGGKLFFPQGIYIDNQAPNANLFSLWINAVPTTQPFLSIELEGAVAMGSNSNTTSDPTGGSYLYGMSAPSGGSFLGVIPNAGPAFSFVDLKLKDIALILPQKNSVEAIHAGYAYNFHGENINIDVNKPTNASTAATPTNTNSIGIRLPQNLNAGQVLLMNSFVRGYYYGAQVYEHANLIHDSFQSDLVGIKENSTSTFHAVFLYGMLIQDSQYGIQFNTEPTYGNVDFEDDTTIQFDLDGGTGGAMGAGFLAVHKSGANALLVRNLSQKLVYKVDDQVDGPKLISPIQFVSYTFATLPTVVNGLQVYCSDCVSGTFDAAAASGGTGTTVLGENGAWRGH